MKLKILLPDRIFADIGGVSRIVAESVDGAFGLLPRRLDCAVALAPGILLYETDADGEVCVAVDQGVLVKAGAEVRVSVRSAMAGADLGSLREAVDREFLALDAQEKTLRDALNKLEGTLVRRLAEFSHD
ncbi:F0F1 ATP synthase subunit epsilon [Denitromonas ohlonensis]|uniref:F0F1 ATP synthase subunit epsilon n=2 Tax=Denitromonas TaxID=139331 RepID=A0A557SL65_9RHOO|nr:F0F1 ATP synthase subunit epsilon [Denitromonas ohlonensis]TVO67931.1 F0F1 ATP synthase subunit epsilon [Denitromonas ohlonensis]TVO78164.1 F0F1 ATP synthase subunit epsilon [Denitromonas ohlonensis]